MMKSISIFRPGSVKLSSADDLLQHGLQRFPGSRSRGLARLRARARAKSRLVDQPVIRTTLSWIGRRIFWFLVVSSSATQQTLRPSRSPRPGLRRSARAPRRTDRAFGRPALVDGVGAPLHWTIRSLASRCKAISSANSLNMPIVSGVFSRAGLGSMAHSVPKKRPSATDDRHRDVALEAVHRRGLDGRNSARPRRRGR